MYIDGVYMGRGRQFRSPFFDIERVEVLRGPQGILFGKNTIAGAITVTSKSPDINEDAEGFISARYEPKYNTKEISGAISMPLGDTAAVRLAGKTSSSDGYITNVTLGSSSTQPDDKSFRTTFVWEPTDNLDFNFKYNHSTFETTGSPLTPHVFKLIDDPKAPLDALAFALVGIVQPDFDNSNPYNGYIDADTGLGIGPEGTDTSVDNVSLTTNYQMSDLTLTSVTGYSKFRGEDIQDVDWLPIRMIARSDDRRFKQLSQELRLMSDEGGTYEYIVGVYGDKQEFSVDGHIGLDTSIGGLTNSTIGAPSIFAGFLPLFGTSFDEFPVVDVGRDGFYTMEAETYAAFAEFTYNVNEDLKVTIGGRYSREKKEATKVLTLSSDATGGLGIPTDHAAVAGIWAAGFSTFAHDVEGDRTTSHFDPSVKVMWDMNDDMMLYVNYSEGFKSGGFNSTDDLNPFVLLDNGDIKGFEYDDEEAESFELGLKAEFADGAGRYNVAFFTTDYKNLQVSSFQGTNFILSNAAAAEIRGIEVDGQLRVTEGLTLSGSLGYLDFEFSEFTSAPCTAAMIAATAEGIVCKNDLSGQTNAFAPKWSGNLSANYYHEIENNMAIMIDVDMNFKSEMYIDYDLDEDILEPGYGKLNVRVALESTDQVWWVAAYGRNLTDKVTFSSSIDTPLVTGSHSSMPNEDRVFGVEVGYRFD